MLIDGVIYFEQFHFLARLPSGLGYSMSVLCRPLVGQDGASKCTLVAGCLDINFLQFC